MSDNRRRSRGNSKAAALRLAGLALLIAGLLTLPAVAGPYIVHMFILTLFAVVLGVTYRLLLLAGEASFCHGTFYGLGAYTVAVLTTKAGLSFWVSLPVGALVGLLSALVIGFPSLQTRGAYFFLMTFGFFVVVNSLLENLDWLTGGFSGIAGISAPAGIGGIREFFYLSVVLCLGTVVIFWRFEHSRWGLELRGLHDSNELAQSVGVSRMGNMLAAFAVGALFCSLMGGVYASYITFVSPNSFSLWLSVFALTYVIVGGVGHIVGVVVGAAYLTLIPVLFNWSQHRVGIFAAASIVAVMMLAPRGVIDEAIERARRWRRQGDARRATSAPSEGVETPGNNGGGEMASAAACAPPRARAGSDLLVIRRLDRAFGGVHAVRGVTLSIRSGETLGLIGPNGAGKSTLFNLISGFVRPDRGEVLFAGTSLVGMAPHQIARRGLTRTFQAAAVFDRLTVFENVLLGAGAKHSVHAWRRALVPGHAVRHQAECAAEALELVGLAPLANERAGNLPYGLKKIVGLAIALATRPALLCLDEPVTGMTGSEVERMVTVLRKIQATGDLAMVIVEHRLPVIMDLCDRVIVLDFGEVLAEGTPAEIRQNPDVLRVYLGEDRGVYVRV